VPGRGESVRRGEKKDVSGVITTKATSHLPRLEEKIIHRKEGDDAAILQEATKDKVCGMGSKLGLARK